MSKKDQTAADKAFIGSDRHTLDDLKLQPWTPQRIIAAQEMGLLYPNLGKQGWAQFRRTNVYPGALKDVMIFLFLSTLDENEVDEATFADARKFGAGRGIHLADGQGFWDAFHKFVEVVSEVYAGATKPKTGGDEDEDDPKT